jgi:hypothetical protein
MKASDFNRILAELKMRYLSTKSRDKAMNAMKKLRKVVEIMEMRGLRSLVKR